MRIAHVGRLGHRRADVAPVDHLAAELADPRLELRVADRRRAHVDPAAAGAEIEPGPDDRNPQPLLVGAHSAGNLRHRPAVPPRPTGRARRTEQSVLRWRGPDLNRRHHGFQPCALPTELPRPAGRKCSRTKRDVRTGATASRTSLCREAYDDSSLRASSASPGPTQKSATCANPRCSSSRRTRSSGTQIGVRRPCVKAIATCPPGAVDARELVEERDHVVRASPDRSSPSANGRRGRIGDLT